MVYSCVSAEGSILNITIEHGNEHIMFRYTKAESGFQFSHTIARTYIKNSFSRCGKIETAFVGNPCGTFQVIKIKYDSYDDRLIIFIDDDEFWLSNAVRNTTLIDVIPSCIWDMSKLIIPLEKIRKKIFKTFN